MHDSSTRLPKGLAILCPPAPSCPGRLERFILVLLTPPKLPTLGLRASLVLFVSDVFLYIKASDFKLYF